MFPVLIDVSGFALHTYGAMGAIGFLILCALSIRHAKNVGWDVDSLIDVIFWSAIAGIGGARVLFFLQNPEAYDGLFSIVNMRTGGMVFYGAFLGLPVGWWTLHRSGLPTWDVLDVFGRLLPLAHAFSRLGCVGAGCCYGSHTDVPWAITYTHPLAAAPLNRALHPVQAYEAFGLFMLSALLTWRSPHKRFAGEIMLAYVGGYALLRAFTELFRGDADRYFLFTDQLGESLSTSQGLAIVFFLMAAALWPALAARGRAAQA